MKLEGLRTQSPQWSYVTYRLFIANRTLIDGDAMVLMFEQSVRHMAWSVSSTVY